MRTQCGRRPRTFVIGYILYAVAVSGYATQDGANSNCGNSTCSSYDFNWNVADRPRGLVDLQKLYAVFKRTADDTEEYSLFLEKMSAKRADDNVDVDTDQQVDGGRGESFRADHNQEQDDEVDRSNLAVRAIMKDLFDPNDRLFARPLPNGEVELSLLPRGYGLKALPDSHGLIFQSVYKHYSLFVYGMVGNDVEEVDVVIAGKTSKAKMAKNAFAMKTDVENRVERPDSVILHLRGGGTVDL